MAVAVVLTGPEPSGLAEMLAGLLESNLVRRPKRGRLLRPAVVVVEAADAGVSVALRLGRDRIEVSEGAGSGAADVQIRADAADLLALSNAPLRLGLPDPLHRDGRAVLVRVIGRHVRITGALRHPLVLSRFARLLSVA